MARSRADGAPVAPLRLLVALAALLAVTLAAPRRAAAQDLQRATRFQISSVGDSTFDFALGNAKWVRVAAHGIVVDPRRRDALVAKFEVLRIDRGSATALITGETMRVTLDHFAVLEEPRMPWFAQRTFWVGAVLGLVVGAGFGSQR
jgi:hypothetical protein